MESNRWSVLTKRINSEESFVSGFGWAALYIQYFTMPKQNTIKDRSWDFKNWYREQEQHHPVQFFLRLWWTHGFAMTLVCEKVFWGTAVFCSVACRLCVFSGSHMIASLPWASWHWNALQSSNYNFHETWLIHQTPY